MFSVLAELYPLLPYVAAERGSNRCPQEQSPKIAVS